MNCGCKPHESLCQNVRRSMSEMRAKMSNTMLKPKISEPIPAPSDGPNREVQLIFCVQTVHSHPKTHRSAEVCGRKHRENRRNSERKQ